MPKCLAEIALVTFAAVTGLPACDTKAEAVPTPPTAASAIPPPAAPTGPKALRFAIEPGGKTSIDMPAPKERIRADTTATAGELTLDTVDLQKSRAQVKVDLTTLTTHTFGDKGKDSAQTEHAHNWLEAGTLVTPDVKEANRWAVFTIREVTGATAHDLAAVAAVHGDTDDGKTLEATVKGDFFLHGHSVVKEVPVVVVVHYPTGQASTAAPTRVEVRTKAPLHVVLADHDVKPRDSLGKLAQASFSLLGTKVAETADVTFDLTAVPAP